MENAQKTANAPIEFEQNLQKYIRTAADLSMSYSKLDADQRLGVTHAVVGLLFIILGISFFFQSLLLSLGNALVIYGLVEIMGAEAFLNFVRPANKNTSNYGVFLLGLALILIMNGWGMIGFILELYGLYKTLRERCDQSELTELMSLAQSMIIQRLKFLPFLKSFTREDSELPSNEKLGGSLRSIKDAPLEDTQVTSDAATAEPIGDTTTQLKERKRVAAAEAQNNLIRDQASCHDTNHAKEGGKQENTAEAPSPSRAEDEKKGRAGKRAPEKDLPANELPILEMGTTTATEQQAKLDKVDALDKLNSQTLQIESDPENPDKATNERVDENKAGRNDALVQSATPEATSEKEAESTHKSPTEFAAEGAHAVQQTAAEAVRPEEHQSGDVSQSEYAS